MSPFLQEAEEGLRRVESLLGELGLRSVRISPHTVGVGVGIAWGESDFVVLSIGATNAGWVYITGGVRKDVAQDRLAALVLCNEIGHSNPAFNFFLHDADVGWDIIVQQTFPIQLLTDVPPFFAMTLESVPASVGEAGPQFAEALGGQAYRWGAEDVQRLLVRSLI